MKMLLRGICLLMALFLGSALFSTTSQAEVVTTRACEMDSPPPGCEQGNKWVTLVYNEIPPGLYTYTPTPECMNGVSSGLANVLVAAAAARHPVTAMFAGEISTLVGGPINGFIDERVRGDLGRIFNPHGDATARCAILGVSIPARATYLGYRLEMTDNWEGWVPRRCQVGQECGQGWSKFPFEPVRQGNEHAQFITVQFMNWSHNRPRVARMYVLYEMPEGSVPVTSF